MILKFILFISAATLNAAYDEVSEFKQVLQDEKHLLVLFTEECCSCIDCVEHETMLGAMSKTLEEMGLLTVKLKTDELKSLYGIKKAPAIIYIRDRIPVLYDGTLEPEAIYWFLTDNREPYTKVLNDQTFEHLTQAATGSTTGDWLVAFYDGACVNKNALYTHLDGVAVHLKARVNVAIVNKKDSPETFLRFKVTKCPEILFFHHGKMYRTIWGNASDLKLFAERLYKEFKAEIIAAPQTYFDKLIEHYAQNHLVSLTFAFVMFVVIVIFALFRNKKQKSE